VAEAAVVEFTLLLQIINGVHHILQLAYLLVVESVLDKTILPQLLVLQILDLAAVELITVQISQQVLEDLELL